MPAPTILRSVSSLSLAGPIVAIILVFRTGGLDGMNFSPDIAL
jgi:hypothetical protein